MEEIKKSLVDEISVVIDRHMRSIAYHYREERGNLLNFGLGRLGVSGKTPGDREIYSSKILSTVEKREN